MTFSSNRSLAARIAPAPSGNRFSPALFILSTGLALGTAVLLFAASVQAQTTAPTPAPTVAAASHKPKYTVAQIAQAFSFIDRNRDGKLSREEAAGFRGVARHFDEADINKDSVLSQREFENALNREKIPQ